MHVSHFKGLIIMLYLDFGAQGHGSTFTFCHTHLKRAILLHKLARVPFDLLIAVHKNRCEILQIKKSSKLNSFDVSIGKGFPVI